MSDEPAKRWTPERSWAHGGNDPLDDVSAFDADGHWRYVGTGPGTRLCLRVAPTGEEPPSWPVAVLQELARDAVVADHPYAPGHRVDLGRSIVHGSDLRTVAFIRDPDDPDSLLVVGLTTDEYDVLRRWNAQAFLAAVAEHANPALVTDPGRGSMLADVSLSDAVARGIARDGSSTLELAVPGLAVESVDDGVKVSVSRDVVPELRRALAGRLLHGRPLRLEDARVAVTLAVGGSFAVLDEETDVTVEVPTEAVEDLLASLASGAPGSFEPVPGFRVVVG